MEISGLLNNYESASIHKMKHTEGGSEVKNFLHVLQNKIQTISYSDEKSLTSTTNRNLTLGRRPVDKHNNSRKSQNEANITEKSTIQDSRPSNNVEVDNKVDNKLENDSEIYTANELMGNKEDRLKLFLSDLENEEKTLLELDEMVSPELIQQIQELLSILYQQGLITEDAAQEIKIRLEETTGLKETVLLLDYQLQQLDTQLETHFDKQYLETLTVKDVEDYVKLLSKISKEGSNQFLGNANKEYPLIEKDLEVNQMVSEKASTDFVDDGIEIEVSEKPQKTKDQLDMLFMNKTFKNQNNEKLEDNTHYFTVDLNKSFDIKLNSIVDQSIDAKEIFGKNFLEELIHKVDEVYRTGKNQLKLQLVPENLGKLSISLVSENQIVKAKVYVESLQVKEMLESNLIDFKDSLKERGINIGNIEVSVGQDPETLQQRRNYIIPKNKMKRTSLDVEKMVGLVQNLETSINNNPYLVTSNFDQLG